MNKFYFSLPLVLLVAFSLLLFLKLKDNASPQFFQTSDRKTLPEFSLKEPFGTGPGLKNSDLVRGTWIINFFGSWCIPCQAEHEEWMKAKENHTLPLIGINWKDLEEDASAWLERLGNPYMRIGIDPQSKAAVAFGITGAPETFVVRDGIIIYHHASPITEQILNDEILPRLAP